MRLNIVCAGATTVLSIAGAGVVASGNALWGAAALAAAAAVWLTLAPGGGYLLTVGAVALSSVNGVKFGLLTASDLLLLPATALALVALHRTGGRLPVWLAAPSAALVLIVAVAGLIRDDAPATVAAGLEFIGLLLLVVVPVAVFGDTPSRRRGLVAAYVVGAAANGGLAILDRYGIWNLASQLTNFQGFQWSGRVTGLTNHSNLLGAACALAVPFVLFLAARRRLWLVALLPLLGGVLASGSRAGLLAIPLGGLGYILLRRRNVLGRAALVATGSVIALVAAAAVGLNVGLDRLSDGSAAESDAIRYELAEQAWADFSARPVLGVGFSVGRAHSLYLEVARSGGLIALLAVVAILCGALFAGWRHSRDPVISAALAALGAWLVIAVQHNGLSDRFLWVPLGVVLALAVHSRRLSDRSFSQAAPSPSDNASSASQKLSYSEYTPPAIISVPTDISRR